MRIPLAWLQLSREKMRLLVAIAGIGFADILMFMQLGFRDALFDSAVTLHKNFQGDIFLISTQSTAIIAMKSFPHRRLYQALGFEGVKSVSPVYLGLALWRNPENLHMRPSISPSGEDNKESRNSQTSPESKTADTRSILVVGFNPADKVLNLPKINRNLDKITLANVVLFDDASRPEFGPIAQWFNQGKDVTTEVGERRIRVGGLFTLGASFGADGNIVTSDLNFLRLFPAREKGLIEVGIIELKRGVNQKRVLENLRRELPNDVKILSKQEFIDVEKSYWQTSTAIGFIFSLGTAMGFIVGTVIVYQILYTDVADHLPEYATLKAMGYKTSYLLGVVFQEALILSILGYFPGFFMASILYGLTKSATSLPMAMTLARAVTVLILTMIMCCISGAIAVRKLDAADPADIF
ncbi:MULTISPECIES: ABC transporter permease DevC [unclassified Coleofasciculus]|uniref:ABC transporter permease DevC n=1 Tax=unclassified Coleofasciculus TaxID=2692782 RepID=UPI00187DEBBA|nr:MULTISPECIES: ABC transporter permease DevC [unclassified Coleofasciculus]MBE9128718.1 FtsX-like permease family protein [Coleofasciculus sp. LEGE 07081]MBE9151487.1 FtsX-like permease family protein [Coleofasciculus sp. LEGE 07092]